MLGKMPLAALVEITGGFWRLYGMDGLACCTPDTVKPAGQSQAERRGSATGVARKCWGASHAAAMGRVATGDTGVRRRRVRLAPPAVAYEAEAAGSEQESWETGRR